MASPKQVGKQSSQFFKQTYQDAVMRRGCMNELNMCCQTLCTKQAVLNYITHLESTLKEAAQTIARLEKQGEAR